MTVMIIKLGHKTQNMVSNLPFYLHKRAVFWVLSAQGLQMTQQEKQDTNHCDSKQLSVLTDTLTAVSWERTVGLRAGICKRE